MKKSFAMFLVAVIVLFSGCVAQSSDRTKSKNRSKADAVENNTGEAITEDIEFLDEGENLTEYSVERTYGFKDGYALIEFANASGSEEYYGIINTDGRITYAFPHDDYVYCEHYSNGRFYFSRSYNNSFDIFCINSSGELIYNLNFSDGENFSCGLQAFSEDSSFIISKTNNSFYDGSFVQVAKYDSSGECVYDWADIELDGSKAISIDMGTIVSEYAIASVEFPQPVGWKLLLIKVDNTVSVVGDVSSEEFNFCGASSTFAYENVVSTLGNMVVADSEEDYLFFNSADNCIYNMKNGTSVARVTLPEGCIGWDRSGFINGYAMLFIQKETNGNYDYYLTLIDVNGNFAFEPKQVDAFGEHFWDGTRLLIVKSDYSAFSFYDVNGELQCEVGRTIICGTLGGFSEGYAYGATDNYGDGCCYIKYDGTVLFPEGTVSVDKNKIAQSF